MEVRSSAISTITVLDSVLNDLYITALHAHEAIKGESFVFIELYRLGKTKCELNTKTEQLDYFT